MSQVIIDRVNASFGYQAINRISVTQTLFNPDHSSNTLQVRESTKDQDDIWTLDEKLKNVSSPELRAALRRLGGPTFKSAEEDEGTLENQYSDPQEKVANLSHNHD